MFSQPNNMPGTPSPLVETLRQLDEAEAWRTVVPLSEVSGADRWHPLDRLDDATVARWYESLRDGPGGGHGDVAASYLAGWLGGIVAQPLVDALLTRRRAWPASSADLAVHRNDGGWFDGLAVGGSTLWVLGDDVDAAVVAGADAGGPAATLVATFEQLTARVADDLVATVDPIFHMIRRLAPFGRRGMWGSLADSLTGRALTQALVAGHDGRAAWSTVSVLLDALGARVPGRWARPKLERFDWSGGTAQLTVRGTCCLYHKLAENPDPCGDHDYCGDCPFRDPDDRRRRWAQWLDTEAAARSSALL